MNAADQPLKSVTVSTNVGVGVGLHGSVYGRCWVTVDKVYRDLYDDMLDLYRKCEDFILRNGEDPEIIRKKFIKKYFKS